MNHFVFEEFQQMLEEAKSDYSSLRKLVADMEQLSNQCLWFVDMQLEGRELECFHLELGNPDMMKVVDGMGMKMLGCIDQGIAQQVENTLVNHLANGIVLKELAKTMCKLTNMGKWYLNIIAKNLLATLIADVKESDLEDEGWLNQMQEFGESDECPHEAECMEYQEEHESIVPRLDCCCEGKSNVPAATKEDSGMNGKECVNQMQKVEDIDECPSEAESTDVQGGMESKNPSQGCSEGKCAVPDAVAEEDDDAWVDEVVDSWSGLKNFGNSPPKTDDIGIKGGTIGTKTLSEEIDYYFKDFDGSALSEAGRAKKPDEGMAAKKAPTDPRKVIYNFFQRNKRRIGTDKKTRCKIQPDGTVNADGDVVLTKHDFVDGKLPFSFGVVNGSFSCCNLDFDRLSMEGFPHAVYGDFDCSYCIIKDYKGPMDIKGDFVCIDAILPKEFMYGKWDPSSVMPSLGGDFVYEDDNKGYSRRGRPSKQFKQLQAEMREQRIAAGKITEIYI